MIFQRTRGLLLRKGHVPPAPGWTSVDGEEPWVGPTLVALSPEWMPIFHDPIILIFNKYNRGLVCVKNSSQPGDAFQMRGSRAWSMEGSSQPLGDGGSALLIILTAASSFSVSGPHVLLAYLRSLYWRLQSRLARPWKLPGSSAAFSVLHSQPHFVQSF